MKAKDLIKILQNNPEADILIHASPYDDYAIGNCKTAHSYQAGDTNVEESGEDFSDSFDEDGKLLVPVIILS